MAPSIIFALRDFVSCSRTPAYVRGKRGIVTALHGSIVNPLDHRGMYPPLCSVVFPVREVSGGASQDTLSVDVHEDWLAPLGPPC